MVKGHYTVYYELILVLISVDADTDIGSVFYKLKYFSSGIFFFFCFRNLLFISTLFPLEGFLNEEPGFI